MIQKTKKFKACVACNSQYVSKRRTQKFCSIACQQKFWHEERAWVKLDHVIPEFRSLYEN